MLKSMRSLCKNTASEFQSNISEILSLCVPIFFEQFAYSLCSVLISTVVSRMGSSEVAGYNLAESINTVINQFITSLGAGAAVLVSQYRGKGDPDSTGRVAVQSLYLFFICGSALSIILLFGHDLILSLIIGGTEKAVYDNARTFFIVSSFSYPLLALYTGSCNIIRGSGFPKKTMAVSIVTNVLYAILSFVFIVWLKLGMYGPGIALILARGYGAIYGSYMVRCGNDNMIVNTLKIKRLDLSTIKLVLYMGVPIGIENVMFQFGRLVTQTFIIPLGTASITANAIANNMAGLLLVPGNALQLAVVPIIGKYIGMDKPRIAKSFTISCTFLCFFISAVVCAVTAIVLDGFIGLYDQSEEVNTLIRSIYMMYLWLMPTIWPISFVIPAALRAAGDVRNNMVTAIASMIIFRVGASYVLTKYTSLGIHGIWVGMYLDWIFRSILFVVRLCGKKWLTKKVV